jgi:predicted dehydrogenase
MDTLDFLLVGCGHIGQRHLDVLLDHSDVALQAVCDINGDILEKLRARHSDLPLYARYEQMLAEVPADIVSICTPHGLHAEMSIQATRAGRHVLVEKPMALTSAESYDMIEAAAQEDVHLYVVKQNRYNAPSRLTHRALREERLGEIYMVQCNVMWNRHAGYYEKSPWRGLKHLEGGALHTQASHFIDLLVWWFGELAEARTLLATLKHDIEFEDCGVAALRFESGALGSLLWTTCAHHANYEGSITILGERGTIKIGGPYLNEIEHWDVQSYPMPRDVTFDDEPNDYGRYKGSSSNHPALIDAVVQQFLADRRGIVEGEEGKKTLDAIETIYGAAS